MDTLSVHGENARESVDESALCRRENDDGRGLSLLAEASLR